MNWIEAFILGVIQGITEFLPVSSSGHLEIGKALLGISGEENMYFTIVVHGATVLSTIVVFRKDIWELMNGFFKFKYNKETEYVFKIAVSMIPVAIVGLFLKNELKQLFANPNIILVGSMLIVTAALLAFTYFSKNKKGKISYLDAFIIGIAQAVSVIPGVSRSGSTIATGMILGNDKSQLAKFSFLMILIPILGENFLDLLGGNFSSTENLHVSSLLIGFVAAFFSGLFACKLMIKIVKKGKLIHFATYCFIVGLIAISTSFC